MRKVVGCAIWLGLSAGFAVSACAADQLPIEHFTKKADIDDVVLSPSGKRLAMLSFGPEGRRQVGVMDLAKMGDMRIVANYANADVYDVHWVNDDRLVYYASEPGVEIRQGYSGLYAVNHDGSDKRVLVSRQYVVGDATGSLIRTHTLPVGWEFHSTIDDGSDDIFVEHTIYDSLGDFKQSELARVNTNTGITRSMSLGLPSGTYRWLMDANHEPRMVTADRDGRVISYWRPPHSAEWVPIDDFQAHREPGISPWFIDANGQVMVVTHGSRDTSAIYHFDPVTKSVDKEPAIAVKGFDLHSSPVVDSKSGHLLGIRFLTDRPAAYWMDSAIDKVQRSVDAALPKGRSNTLHCGRCETTRFFVVFSVSDRQPGEYYLFDKEKLSLTLVGATRPWIQEETQATRTFHRFAARDGLSIPVYVTQPVGSTLGQPLPTVVLVHGGPNLRGVSVEWEQEAQFLASRGYLVIEPEFRGSEGYGFRLFHAGWKQWGHAMQDDLVDAVRWAAKEKLADPSRVCIEGGSYGGYAALMGPIADPGVYRCAASFAGVTDIGLLYSIRWSDETEAARRYSMPVLIGDPEKDADLFASASPLKRVAEIKVPILLGYGMLDRRVPKEHAHAFEDAAKRAGVAVESVEYAQEGHGFYLADDETDYFRRLEKLLAKSLQDDHAP